MSNSGGTLTAAAKRLGCVRFEALQRFFQDFVGQLEVRIEDGDQAGFNKHPKRTDLEGKRSFSVQYIKDAEDRLVRDMGLIRDRWVEWFIK